MPDTTAPRPWTPGPWKLFDDETCFVGYIMHDEGFRAHIFETAGQQEDEANALLIAAAPELFEALAEAVRMYGSEGGPWNVPSHPGSWIAQARAALAKALGGQP